MTLQELNNQIHAIKSENEMNTKLSSFKSNIKSTLDAGEPESYYMNHTGRELHKKLSNFGMESEIASIGDLHDAGFRPLTATGIRG